LLHKTMIDRLWELRGQPMM